MSRGHPRAEPSATRRLTGASSGRGPTQTSEVSLGVRARLLELPGLLAVGPLGNCLSPRLSRVLPPRPTDCRSVGGALANRSQCDQHSVSRRDTGERDPWDHCPPTVSGAGPRELTHGQVTSDAGQPPRG